MVRGGRIAAPPPGGIQVRERAALNLTYGQER